MRRINPLSPKYRQLLALNAKFEKEHKRSIEQKMLDRLENAKIVRYLLRLRH